MSIRKALPAAATVMLAAMAAYPAAALRAQGPDPATLADSLAGLVYQGAIAGDTEVLTSARTLAERALTAFPGDALLEHHLAEAYYREAALLMQRDADSAQALLDRAQAILDRTVDRDGALAETHALRASVIGMRITSMARGMVLGPRADRALGRAMALDPASPRVWLARGISTLHKPGFAGGGAEKALEDLERGLSLVDRVRPERGQPAGCAAELWAWVGVTHLRSDRPAEARAAFRRALELEPGFAWVRDVLLPQAEGVTGP